MVGNSDGDPGREVAAGFPHMPITYVEEPRPGYSRARNAALRAAAGDALLFTDDDCLAAPGWCEVLAEAVLGGGADIAGGAKLPPEDAGYVMRADYYNTESFALHPCLPPGPRPALSTSNLAIGRKARAAIGSFDEHFPMCEDRDYCLRAGRLGLSVVFEPRALVVHAGLADSIGGYLDKMRRYGRGTAFCLHAHRDREPLAVFVPERPWLAAAASPIMVPMTMAYFMWRNLRAGMWRAIPFFPLMAAGAFWWQRGTVEGAALRRGRA